MRSKRITKGVLLVFVMTVAMVASSLLPAAAAAYDDNIPGVPLPASPVKGSLNDITGDYDDVYAVHLDQGEQITFLTTGAAGTDFDIFLFSPTAETVDLTEMPVASSATTDTSSEAFSYIAPAAGTYYLDVYSFYGTGIYTLNWDKDPEADNDIPGIPLPATGFTRMLDGVDDVDDVYAVPLSAGDVLTVSMSGSADTNFDLDLLAPDASAVASDPVAWSETDAYPETLTYTVPTTGTYFLDVYGAGDSIGTYTLSYWNTISGPSAPASVYRTKPMTVSGFIKPQYTAGTSPARIYKYRWDAKTKRWISSGYVLAKVQDYTSGGETFSKYVANVPLPTTGTWMLRSYHPADATHGAIWGATYDYVTVLDVSVRTPIAPTTMYRTRYSTVWGTLAPRHTSGTYPVRIYKWRLVSGKWKPYGYVNARVSNYSSYSKYSASVKLPYAGKWRLSAYHPADATHPAKWSTGYDYVTVR